MDNIEEIKKRFEKGYVMSIYGTSANLHNQMRSDIETLLKALSIHDVSYPVAQQYAEFCVRCDREKLPLIKIEDYLKQL